MSVNSASLDIRPANAMPTGEEKQPSKVDQGAFAQIESRISYRLEIEGSSEEDIRVWCDHENIGNARAVTKLVRPGQGPPGLRMVADVIAQTRLIVGERAIAPADVEKTLAFMGVQI